jgi:predicted DNA-binding antitoxin AbrB/MazE fold protein
MSKVIDAVYENGVLKPMKKLRLKDKQQVRIQILNDEDWQERFGKVLTSIRGKAARFSPEEIEADIAEAIREVRREKRARESRA